jgi:sortase A
VSPVRRALRLLSSVMMVAGALLIADAVLTVVWQEPVTALYAKVRQGALGDELRDLERRPPTGAERRALARIKSRPGRIAFRARALRRGLREGQAIGRIRIRSAGVNKVFVEGTSAGALRKGPGHYPKTPLPGLRGTVGIAGHRTTYAAPFRNIQKINRGDEITVEMPYAKFTYRVEKRRIVPPTEISVVKRVGYDRLVLTACHPKYSARQRIVVFARVVRAVERG